MPGPTKAVATHLDREGLDAAIEAAQRNGEARLVRRLCLVKNCYAGDTLTEAASRVGVSQPTASRWVDAWNDDGVDGLRPDFGGGRPPRLTDDERDRLAAVLERHPSLTVGQVGTLIEEAFGVTYSRRHVARLVERLEPGNLAARRDAPAPTDSGSERPGGPLDAARDDLHAPESDDIDPVE